MEVLTDLIQVEMASPTGEHLLRQLLAIGQRERSFANVQLGRGL